MIKAFDAIVVSTGVLLVASPAIAGGEWVEFVEQTDLRMPASLNDPATSTADQEEKDYAWGDVDNDGDMDLVCVRKQPFTSTGKRTNVLFMNEGTAEGHAVNGIFADRTLEYSTASDVAGDQGFLTATNDRDVVLVDVDNDGWLDIVTATTLTDNQAKHLSHPRVYMNLGEIGGEWQGFRHEDARIPDMHSPAGPRFCSVAAGDVTGDGFADLYFGDYDSGGSQLFDYNNKLLINDGTGHFTDQSNTRLTAEMRASAFGAASAIEDMNDDGVLDVVKQTSLNNPTHVAVTYNDPTNEGVFIGYDTVYSLAAYFISVGDLNGDGRLDIVIVDDGTDRYMLNQGNDADGQASWSTLTFPGSSNGFGSNAIIDDLNNDGNNDVIVTDVDVDIPGCSRQAHFYRNLGNVPNVTFAEQGQVVPNSLLTGTHDIAVFDIDGDGWKDLVVGRCTDTRVWRNVPPIGLVFNYPQGLPSFITPGEPFEFEVQVAAFGGGVPDTGTGRIHLSVDGGPFETGDMVDLGGDLYRATLPAVGCVEQVRLYVSAEAVGGSVFTDPADAPTTSFVGVGASGTEITFRDEMEEDVSAWTVENIALTSGAWEAVTPVGSIWGGELAAPDMDATAGQSNTRAFVTQNGLESDPASINDIDGGPTILTSPAIDLSGTDGTVSFARWFFCHTDDDGLEVEVSNDDGASWVPVPELTTGGTEGEWETVSFVVGNYVVPTSQVRVRFLAADNPNGSITEAGLDNFQVEVFVCDSPCPADVDGNLVVDFQDLLALLASWGPCPGCPADTDGNDEVDFEDLLAMLAAWGPCD